MNKFFYAALTLGFGFTLQTFAADLTAIVDTRIGTDFNPTALTGGPNEKSGNTEPSGALPFGMVQWGPDTDHGDAGSYHFQDQQISGFSLTHLSGTGCKNTSEISVLPLAADQGEETPSAFQHDDEIAEPGFYEVLLQNGIKAELSGTLRTGAARFTFPDTANPKIAMNVKKTGSGSFSDGQLILEDAHHVSGAVDGGNFCGTKNRYTVYFSVEFNQAVQIFSHPKAGIFVLSFSEGGAQAIEMRVGLSYVSVANAKLNRITENASASFDQVRAAASLAWNEALQKIEATGGSPKENKIFYTALYHSLLAPNLYSDVDGSYLGFDKIVHNVKENPEQSAQYANFSGWDIYRSQIQLLSVLFPSITSDIIQSLVNDGKACGAMPKWAQNNDETGVMVGDPAPILVANAYALGAVHFDTAEALAFMKQSATVPGLRCNSHEIRPKLEQYLKYGYVPETWDWFQPSQSASMTLEYASSDFAISQFAKALGDEATFATLSAQSNSWKNLVDPASADLRPRGKNGKFKGSAKSTSMDGFTEGDAAQYSWMVPFDVETLVEKLGGREVAESRLEGLLENLNAGRAADGLWIGNEPSFGIPSIANWLGRPDINQKATSRIMAESFSDQPGGLPGNDDMGATSAWYVWSALGLYPSIPGVGGFAIGRPHFPHLEIHLQTGKLLSLDTTGANANADADKDSVVQSVELNQSPFQKSWVPWSQIRNGGNLRFTLGAQSPISPAWGSEPSAFPPSAKDFSPSSP